MTALRHPESLTDQVYQQIRGQILDGKWAAGTPITEKALCTEMHVSRTPVREAMKQLEAEGLVELRPNRGAVVVGIQQKDIEDIYKIRMLVEGTAAARAAENATEEDLRELGEITDLTEFYIEHHNAENASAMDDRFHHKIYEICGSRILQRILAELHAYAKVIRERSIEVPGRAQAMLKEHQSVLLAIRAHDGKKASECMQQHIWNAAMNLEKSHLIGDKEEGHE